MMAMGVGDSNILLLIEIATNHDGGSVQRWQGSGERRIVRSGLGLKV